MKIIIIKDSKNCNREGKHARDKSLHAEASLHFSMKNKTKQNKNRKKGGRGGVHWPT